MQILLDMKGLTVADVILSIPDARQIAEDWIAAWNARDLERILSHYADDVQFFSPSVVTRYGEPTGMLRGKHVLREHFRRGLEVFGADVRFTIIDVLSGVNGYTVYYSRENGAAVVDTVVVDSLGKGVQVHAHYRAAKPDPAVELSKAQTVDLRSGDRTTVL